MTINYSSNKVRVTKLLGSDAIVGVMDPEVGMMTQYGKITALDADNSQVTVGVGANAMAGSGTVSQKFYPHQLLVASAVAIASHAYPSGVGCVPFGHSLTWPTGVTRDAASGMAMMLGSEVPKLFSRS